MGSRRDARERALKAIFAADGAPAGEETLAMIDGDTPCDNGPVLSFSDELIKGVSSSLTEIDPLISSTSSSWSISRIGRVERAILRLAVYELLHRPDIPVSVVINEAIEIAKRYGTAESPAFVNGILDEIATTLDRRDRRKEMCTS
ncbi:MAG: transcription antitermination factor NusB [Desulfuromonadia bacterium]